MNKLLCFALKPEFLNQENYDTQKECLITPFLHQSLPEHCIAKITHIHYWNTDHYFVLSCDNEIEGYQLETLNFLFRNTNLYLAKADVRKILNSTPGFLESVNEKYKTYGHLEFLDYDLKLPAIKAIS